MSFKLVGAALIVGAVVLAAIALVGLQGSTSTVEAQPLPPAKFYGTVIANGAPAPLGSDIRAKIGGVVCGEALVQTIAGVGTNAYNIDVYHSGFQANCGDPGDTVVFEWASTPTGAPFIPCTPTGVWDNTRFNQLNLVCTGGPTVTPTATPTAPPTATPTAPPTGTPVVTLPATPARTPTAAPVTTPRPAAPPRGGVGPADDGFAWWPLELAAATALAGLGGYIMLRRNAR